MTSFTKGYTPWNKGMKMSPDFKSKVGNQVRQQWATGKRKGGWKQTIENIQPLCVSCNCRKNTKLPEEL